MQILTREAARRGLTERGLADLVKRNESSLARSITTERPTKKSIDGIAKALGLPEIVGGLLAEDLTANEIELLRVQACEQVAIRQRHLFSDPALAAESLLNALLALPEDTTRRALCEFGIALYDLDATFADPVLGRNLGHLNAKLEPIFSLRPFIGDAAAIVHAKREGYGAYLWLIEALPLNSVEQADIYSIIKPYLEGTHTSNEEALREVESQRIAARAFRNSLIDVRSE